MTRNTVKVDLGDRAYDIIIRDGLVAGAAGYLAPHLRRPRLAIVTDTNVAKLHLQTLETGLRAAGIAFDTLVLPAGEGTKSWSALQQVVEWLLARKIERDDLIVAFGGGVIGDLAGFAAGILRRGVRFAQIPTTLLAQVDSSVGGKTGINSPQGKNLVGVFNQPELVLCDLDVLETLSPRNFLAGYGEVVKYGLLGDAGFFDWLEINGPKLAAGDAGARATAIRKSCTMKAGIVARDEKERGERALLNLGHTFGHALESATGYSERLLHGEGVALGCVLAFDLSIALGLCAQETTGRIAAHFSDMNMMTYLSEIKGKLPNAAALLALMAQDKKTRDGTTHYILARSIGAAFVSDGVEDKTVLRVLESALDKRR